MRKLIILTASIIRGQFHKKSIGNFYKKYNNFLKNFEVYHIINIDEPIRLKKYFTIYETLNLFDSIIPKDINVEYIIHNKNPGFLNAFKNLMKKIEELDLLSEENIYWWYEDDWLNNKNINFFKIAEIILNNKNSAITFAENSSLGSFRAGPLMNGSYFLNFFNLVKINVMNDTCDPEKQVRRWLSGKDRKNGNDNIHRIINNKNNKIQIILFIYGNEILYSKYFNHWNYPGDHFNEKIKFEYHIINYKNSKYYYSQYNLKKNNYNLKNKSINKIMQIFNNDNIKYYHFIPFIFTDIGRDFNQKYSLSKWMNIDDNTSYKEFKIAESYLGNWKKFDIDQIRISPKYTMNSKFNFCFVILIQILPYIYNKYFQLGIKINFNYFSHSYGNYPNFNIIGNFIKLNYKPNKIPDNFINNELHDLCKIYHNYCGKQIENDNVFEYYSFKNNFKLAKKYMELFFTFDEKILNKKDKYLKLIKNKKTFGIYYGGTNKLNPIEFDKFLKYSNNHLINNDYQNIFICTDRIEIQNKLKEYYNDYDLIIINKNLEDYNNKGINTERLKVISGIIKEIKNTRDIERKTHYEMELKRESAINTIYLQNYIIESFLLAGCDFVLKDNPDELSLCKILNPDLKINIIKKYKNIPWPDSHLELYPIYNSNKDIKIVSIE